MSRVRDSDKDDSRGRDIGSDIGSDMGNRRIRPLSAILALFVGILLLLTTLTQVPAQPTPNDRSGDDSDAVGKAADPFTIQQALAGKTLPLSAAEKRQLYAQLLLGTASLDGDLVTTPIREGTLLSAIEQLALSPDPEQLRLALDLAGRHGHWQRGRELWSAWDAAQLPCTTPLREDDLAAWGTIEEALGNIPTAQSLLRRAGEVATAAPVPPDRQVSPPLDRQINWQLQRALLRGSIAKDAASDPLIRYTLDHDDARLPTSLLCAALGSTALAVYFHDLPQFAAPTNDAERQAQQRTLWLAHIRRASWSLVHKDYATSRDEAQRAIDVADSLSERHRRYAWGLWLESYRETDTLADALQSITASLPKGAAEPLALSFVVQLSQELERPELALQTLRQQLQLTPDLRRALLQLCRDSGRDDLLLQTFQSLIAEQPRELQWRDGMSRYWIARGETDRAVEVWADLANQSPVLSLTCARRLATLGLDRAAHDFAQSAVDAALALRPEPPHAEAPPAEPSQAEAPVAGATAQQTPPTGESPPKTAMGTIEDDLIYPALELRADLFHRRGESSACQQQLAAIDQQLSPAAPTRLHLASYWERIGNYPQAIEILERLLQHDDSDDLLLRLGWLYSESNQGEQALEIYRRLWSQSHSPARRRFLEGRLLQLAARLGRLADLAVELENDLLERGDNATPSSNAQRHPTDAHRQLLVALYTEANDPVSCAEVLADGLSASRAGGATEQDTDRAAILRQMAHAYQRGGDAVNAERMLLELAARFPEQRPDVVRELLSLALQRHDVEAALQYLDQLDSDPSRSAENLELRAGALNQLGLWEHAAETYQKVLALFPQRSEVSLLLGDLLARHGEKSRGIRVFQTLAIAAADSETFAVAVDGLLNLEAPAPILEWAYRQTLLRWVQESCNPSALATHSLTLHHLRHDLAAALSDPNRQRVALEEALPTAGAQRSILLRELCSGAESSTQSSSSKSTSNKSNSRYLRYGYRLLALGERQPPSVYVDLGEKLLEAQRPGAHWVFSLIDDPRDFDQYRERIARTLERSGHPSGALTVLEDALLTNPTDARLLQQVAELNEQLGRNEHAWGHYRQALSLLSERRPSTHFVGTELDPTRRDIDLWQQLSPRLLEGLLTTFDAPLLKHPHTPADAVSSYLQTLLQRIEREIDELQRQESLQRHPRLLALIEIYTRVALATLRITAIDTLDRKLIAAFPNDLDTHRGRLQRRLAWGYREASKSFLERLAPGAVREHLLAQIPAPRHDEALTPLPPSVMRTSGTFLLMQGDVAARALLERISRHQDTPSATEELPLLLAAATTLRDAPSSFAFAHAWLHDAVSQRGGLELHYEILRRFDPLWSVLDDTQRRALIQSVMGYLQQNRERFNALARTVALLQRDFTQRGLAPPVTLEEVLALFDDYDGSGLLGRPRGTAGLLSLLPVPERLAMLRQLRPRVRARARPGLISAVVSTLPTPLTPEQESTLVEMFESAIVGTRPVSHVYLQPYLFESEHTALCSEFLQILADRFPDSLDCVAGAGFVLRRQLQQCDPATAAALQDRVEVVETRLLELLLLPRRDDWNTQQELQRTIRLASPELLRQLEQRLRLLADPSFGFLHRLTRERLGDDAGQIQLLEQGLERGQDALFEQLCALLEQCGESWRRSDVLKRWAEEAPGARPARLWIRALRRADNSLELQRGLRQSRSAPPESVEGVQLAVAEGRFDEAAILCRRLWRRFGERGADMMPRPVLMWPLAHSELDWGLPPLDPTSSDENRSLYHELPQFPFAEQELSARLRAMDPEEWQQFPDVLDGVAQVVRQTPGALDSWVSALLTGEGGRLAAEIVSRVLEIPAAKTAAETSPATAIAAERVQEVLTTLARDVDPTAVEQIARLARVGASHVAGARDSAALRGITQSLLRWCSAWIPQRPSNVTTPTLQEITDGSVEVLAESTGSSGAQAHRFVAAWVESLQPSSFASFDDSRWAAYENARLRLSVPSAPPTHETLRRFPRPRGYARALLERTLRHDAPPDGEQESQTRDALEAMIADDPSLPPRPFTPGEWVAMTEFVDRLTPNARTRIWLEQLPQQLALLQQRLQISHSAAVRFAVLVAVRASRSRWPGGADAQGDDFSWRRRLLVSAREWSQRPRDHLWIADAWRQIDPNSAVATEIEVELFEKRQLPVPRLPRALRALAAHDPQRALRVGESWLHYTQSQAFLRSLIEVADQQREEARASAWKALLRQLQSTES